MQQLRSGSRLLERPVGGLFIARIVDQNHQRDRGAAKYIEREQADGVWLLPISSALLRIYDNRWRRHGGRRIFARVAQGAAGGQARTRGGAGPPVVLVTARRPPLTPVVP